MKYAFLLVFSLIAFNSLQAQTAKELIGKWKLVKFTNTKGETKSIKEEYKTDEVYQVFKEDNKFEGIVGDKTRAGKWSLSKDNKELNVKISILSIKFKVIYADAAKRTISSDMIGTLEYVKVDQ
jgi:hypothetical protein